MAAPWYLVVVLESGGGGLLLLLLLAARQLQQELLLLHLRRCLLEALQSLERKPISGTRSTRFWFRSAVEVATHLLALPVGQVTLTQHEAAGADVHLTPGTGQTHILLQTQRR